MCKMERTTFNVLFYIRRTRLNRYGEAPIFMRITVNGDRADAHLKRFIEPRHWNTAKGKAVENAKGGKDLNLFLDAISMNLLRTRRDMELDGADVTAQTVLDRYLGKDAPERHTLMELFREHNDKCRKLSGIDMAPATVQRYETCLKHTEEFMWHTYRQKDIYLDELTRQFIEDYEFYLKTERKCAHNTTTKYLKNFKKIVLIALAKDWLKKDPFAEIRFSLERVERNFLEKHELERIVQKQIDIPRLAQVRDVFAFCCWTGLSFSDVQQLRPEHIVQGMDGTKWIRKPRQKTKNMCDIPLLEVPLQILEKYRDDSRCAAKGVLLPVPCNQKMNAYLKELADICGIDKQITSHTGRHTFATCMFSSGVSMESIAKMLGHSNTNMTRHYARVLDTTVLREVRNAGASFSSTVR
jgi:integrase